MGGAPALISLPPPTTRNNNTFYNRLCKLSWHRDFYLQSTSYIQIQKCWKFIQQYKFRGTPRSQHLDWLCTLAVTRTSSIPLAKPLFQNLFLWFVVKKMSSEFFFRIGFPVICQKRDRIAYSSISGVLRTIFQNGGCCNIESSKYLIHFISPVETFYRNLANSTPLILFLSAKLKHKIFSGHLESSRTMRTHATPDKIMKWIICWSNNWQKTFIVN